MVIPSQEVSRDTTNVCPIIRFHVYRNLSHFTIHDRRPYEEIKTRSICSTIQVTDTIAKVYTRKELVFLMTLITEFHEKFYITEIKQLLFHLLNVRILGTHQCGKELCEEFQRWSELHNVLCGNDYIKRIISSFSHQI